MTWVAWRQFRTSAVIGAAGLVAMAILLWVTTHGGSVACAAGNCTTTGGSFLRLTHNHLLKILSTVLILLPAVVGLFWGAPLVARELEAGTFRLAWTQSVTRSRWLTIKVATVGLAGAAVCGLLSAMLGWWSSGHINAGRMSPSMFAERGIAPIGYAVFALALSIFAGVAFRRTLPAMAVGLFGFVLTRFVIQTVVRQRLLPARHLTLPISGHSGLGLSSSSNGVLSLIPANVTVGNGWTFSQRIVDASGHAPSSQFVASACPGLSNRVMPPGAHGRAVATPAHAIARLQSCFTTVGSRYHEAVAYQPASHYWGLQFLETGIFLALAAGLFGATFWWVRHRLA